MKGKIVPFKEGYRLKVKYWFMFWFSDPGYPTYNSIDGAKRAAYEAGIEIKDTEEK